MSRTTFDSGARTSWVNPGVLAWSITGLTLAVVAAAAFLVFVNRDTIHSLEQANIIEIVLPIGFALLGGLVASRLPGNLIGWIFLAISLMNAIPGATTRYSRYALVTQRGAPFSPWIPWFGSFTDSLVYPAGLAVLAMLLIPTGRFVSPRWRWLAWVGAAVTGLLLLTTMLDPGLLTWEGVPAVTNPTGLPLMAQLGQGWLGYAAFLGGLGVLALAGVSVIVRLRRATGDERLQLRWVASAVVFSVLTNVVSTVLGLIFLPMEVTTFLATITTVIGFGIALPASFAVAILRYRLYDLDLLLNRTVVYGAVTAVLAAAFGIADIYAQRGVESVFHQRSDLVSAGLGVGAALVFGPMRRRARPIVDRFLPARSRLTLLFTDIVGSTQAIVDLGDERWRALLDRYRSTVRQELSRFHGREVNTAGDAFFATFSRPAAAVQCAQAIRSAVKNLGLQVRTGLHIGDVEMRGEQVSGLAVHAAARVMAQAGDDQILVSNDLAEVLADDVPLQDAGRHALKGVPGEWQLFAVESPGSA
jgi:class 3 adenylate cyclase